MNVRSHIDWVVQKFFDLNSVYTTVKVKNNPGKTPREWITEWLEWALANHFLYVLGDSEGPCASIILRPVESDLFDRLQADYFGTLFEFDRSGDTIFVDEAYGPGHYPVLMDIIAAQGKPNVAYRHHNKIQCVPLERMPRVLAMMGR